MKNPNRSQIWAARLFADAVPIVSSALATVHYVDPNGHQSHATLHQVSNRFRLAFVWP